MSRKCKIGHKQAQGKSVEYSAGLLMCLSISQVMTLHARIVCSCATDHFIRWLQGIEGRLDGRRLLHECDT
ncbi:hypothetical protein F5Y14DRAFT_53124 [Nemania sp. NC0429]|nr:hypothetical protein F5Y14DRAFT_53124 [Nemania sp. NC0429]